MTLKETFQERKGFVHKSHCYTEWKNVTLLVLFNSKYHSISAVFDNTEKQGVVPSIFSNSKNCTANGTITTLNQL